MKCAQARPGGSNIAQTAHIARIGLSEVIGMIDVAPTVMRACAFIEQIARKEAADLILGLLMDERTQMEPTAPFVYLLDGAVPNVEIARAARHYKKPRWAPVIINSRPAYEDRTPETTREIMQATAREFM